MLVNCLPVAYALSADDVGLSFTGAELLDTIDMSTGDMADIVYVIKVTSEDGSFSANISGNYTFNGAVFLADTTNPDAPCDYISDGLTESGKALHVSMEMRQSLHLLQLTLSLIFIIAKHFQTSGMENMWRGLMHR